MTTNGTNTENQESLEIGQYESPEKLAIALEAKSKQSIAEKIRKIASEVQGNSISLRQKLQEELTQEEQTEIRKELPGTGVEEVFNKGLTVQERAEEMALKEASKFVPGGEETIKKIGKLETWWNSISDAWDKASSLFSEGKIAAAIGVIFAGLFGRFNLKDWEKKESSTNKEEEVGEIKEKAGKLNENIKQTEYDIGIKLLLGISRDLELKEFGYGILTQEKIMNSSYNKLGIDELNEENKSGLGKKYGLDGKDDELFKVFNMLKSKEQYIDKIIGKEKSNWKEELTLKELVTTFYKYIKPFEKLKEVDIVDFFNGNFDEVFSINFLNPDKGTLNELLDHRLNTEESPFKGVDKNFIITLFLNKETNFEKSKLLGMSNSNEKFIDGFLEFKNKLPELIGNNFFYGKDGTKEEFKDFFKNYQYTVKDVLELYLFTSGEIDTTKFNDLENSLILLKIFSLLGKKPKLRGETYTYMVKEIIKGGPDIVDKIPESFRHIVLEILIKSGEKFVNTTTGLISEAWSCLNGKEKTGLIGIALLSLAGAYYGSAIMGFTFRFVNILKWGFGTSAVAFVYNFLSKSDKGKELFKKNNIQNEKDFEKQLEENQKKLAENK